MNHKLVLGGIECMLVWVALENGGCCASMEREASQHSLSENSEIHNDEVLVVEEEQLLIVQV